MNEKNIEDEIEYLKNTLILLDKRITELGGNMEVEAIKNYEFQKYIFKEIGNMDKYEIQSNLLESDMELNEFERKSKYLKKLLRIKDNPYFGRIDFKSDKLYQIYIGITYLTDDHNNNIIYDWRSAIASLFYQNDLGNTYYNSLEGKISGNLILKRQYKIENRKLIRVFDNSLNITDEVLQQVLTDNSSDKMKNIVNTIQEEQNAIIRNITDKNLIVEGIAGSGKTSVALHRIAYLLYQFKNLRSDNILIFSPNDIFSSYISNVLPELGEDNTKETTFSDFQSSYLKEYKEVESFPNFIARYYNQVVDKKLIEFKQSDKMILLLEKYVLDLKNSIKFTEDLIDKKYYYTKEELNSLFLKYNKLTIIEVYNKIADYICSYNELSISKYKRKIIKDLYHLSNFNPNYKDLYFNFYKSINNIYFISDLDIKKFIYKKSINYEDSLLFIYMKGLINEFPYSNIVHEIVIDEAQDYNRIQFIILKKIFKRASFTILGDVNQTINPYYKYNSLEEINDIISDSKYLKLTKTYRSSEEIIKYANSILNLNYIVAVRKDNNKKVLKRNTEDIKIIKKDLDYGIKNYKRVAIITKNNYETNKLYSLLKESYNISNMLDKELINNPNLLIIPSYLSKGLEFDFVIIYTDIINKYTESEKNLFYVSVTRAQHELIVYNQ